MGGLGLLRQDRAVSEAPERSPSPPLTSGLVLGVDSGGGASVALQLGDDGSHTGTGVSAASWTSGAQASTAGRLRKAGVSGPLGSVFL